MKGQWLGLNTDTNSSIIVNVDELNECYSGYAFIHPNNQSLPSSVTFFNSIDKSQKDELQLNFKALNKVTLTAENWDSVKHNYSDDVFFQETACVSYEIVDNVFKAS